MIFLFSFFLTSQVPSDISSNDEHPEHKVSIFFCSSISLLAFCILGYLFFICLVYFFMCGNTMTDEELLDRTSKGFLQYIYIEWNLISDQKKKEWNLIKVGDKSSTLFRIFHIISKHVLQYSWNDSNCQSFI